jgi:hypothetical protein
MPKFLRSVIAWRLILTAVVLPAMILTGQKAVADIQDEAACKAILDGLDLAELAAAVKVGRGAIIGDHKLGAELIGQECSRAQIVSFMTTAGFLYDGAEEWVEPIGPEFARFTARLSFCAPPTTLLYRLIGRGCGVVARFYLLDGKVTRIAAAAVK